MTLLKREGNEVTTVLDDSMVDSSDILVIRKLRKRNFFAFGAERGLNIYEINPKNITKKL